MEQNPSGGACTEPPPACSPTMAQLCSTSDTRAQRVHLAVPKFQVPRSCSAMARAEAAPGSCCLESRRQEPALPGAVGRRGKSPSSSEGTRGSGQTWGSPAPPGVTLACHSSVPSSKKGIPAMPLVPGYHLHLPLPPGLHIPAQIAVRGNPAALPWKPESLFLFLLGGVSLLLAFTGMHRFPVLDQHTAIKKWCHSIAGYVTTN